jgi:hypothetical protein
MTGRAEGETGCGTLGDACCSSSKGGGRGSAGEDGRACPKAPPAAAITLRLATRQRVFIEKRAPGLGLVLRGSFAGVLAHFVAGAASLASKGVLAPQALMHQAFELCRLMQAATRRQQPGGSLPRPDLGGIRLMHMAVPDIAIMRRAAGGAGWGVSGCAALATPAANTAPKAKPMIDPE